MMLRFLLLVFVFACIMGNIKICADKYPLGTQAAIVTVDDNGCASSDLKAAMHDSNKVITEGTYADDGVGPLLMFIVLLAVLVVVFIIVVINILLIMLAVVMVVALILCGIVSVSTVIGIISKKPSDMIKALFFQLGGVIGVVSGVVVVWGTLEICESLIISDWLCFVIGGGIGMATGLGLAHKFNLFWMGSFKFLLKKFAKSETLIVVKERL